MTPCIFILALMTGYLWGQWNSAECSLIAMSHRKAVRNQLLCSWSLMILLIFQGCLSAYQQILWTISKSFYEFLLSFFGWPELNTLAYNEELWLVEFCLKNNITCLPSTTSIDLALFMWQEFQLSWKFFKTILSNSLNCVLLLIFSFLLVKISSQSIHICVYNNSNYFYTLVSISTNVLILAKWACSFPCIQYSARSKYIYTFKTKTTSTIAKVAYGLHSFFF